MKCARVIFRDAGARFAQIIWIGRQSVMHECCSKHDQFRLASRDLVSELSAVRLQKIIPLGSF